MPLRSIGPLVHELAPVVKDRIERTVYGDLIRPERLPKPACEVWLICGPPASGKSTWVRVHAKPDDIIIDVDAIARETFGMTRERDAAATGALLLARNEMLAALANEPPERVAWVIMGGATDELRGWWCHALNVRGDHLIVMNPGRDELYRRIDCDPDRRAVRHLHKRLVDEWFAKEGGG